MIWTHSYDLLIKIVAMALIIVLGVAVLSFLEARGYVFSGRAFALIGISSILLLFGIIYHFLLRTLSSFLYARLKLKMKISWSQAKQFNKVFTALIPSQKWLPMTGLLTLPQSSRYQQALSILHHHESQEIERRRLANDGSDKPPLSKTVFKVVTVLVVITCFALSLLNLPPASYVAAAQMWLTGGTSYFPVINAMVLAIPACVILFIERRMKWK